MKSTLENYNIFFLIFLLILFSIGINFLATYNISLKHFGEPYYYITRHVQYVFLGLLSFLFFLKIPISFLFNKRIILLAFSGGFLFLLLVFIPDIGKSIGNARRWVEIAFIRFQPSEIFKIIYLLTLVFILDMKKEKKDFFLEGMLLPFLMVFLTFIVIALEPDFSTALILLLTGFALIFIYRTKKTFFLIILSFFFMVFVIIINNKKYLLDRFQFLNSNNSETILNESYQLSKSISAFQNSNILGNNFKSVLQFIKNFPDVHTDFSFAVIVYSYGLFGAIFILFFYYLFIAWTKDVIIQTEDFKEKFLASGILILIALEFSFHILVTLGLFPTTGVFLPFIGYGGTAIITHMGMIGLLTQIKIKTNKKNYGTKTIS